MQSAVHAPLSCCCCCIPFLINRTCLLASRVCICVSRCLDIFRFLMIVNLDISSRTDWLYSQKYDRHNASIKRSFGQSMSQSIGSHQDESAAWEVRCDEYFLSGLLFVCLLLCLFCCAIMLVLRWFFFFRLVSSRSDSLNGQMSIRENRMSNNGRGNVVWRFLENQIERFFLFLFISSKIYFSNTHI